VWRRERRRTRDQTPPVGQPVGRLYPLPAEHETAHVELHDDDDSEPWELGCPVCNAREYRARQAGSQLETLDGIGEATAEKLQAAGIEDVGDLQDADPETLADEVDGVGVDTVEGWQDQAV
jgi:DNA topoisomerase-1